MVYDKPRKVSMNKWAANFGVGGEYHLFTHWGISARISYILDVYKRQDITAIDISDQIKELQQAENSRYHRNE